MDSWGGRFLLFLNKTLSDMVYIYFNDSGDDGEVIELLDLVLVDALLEFFGDAGHFLEVV